MIPTYGDPAYRRRGRAQHPPHDAARAREDRRRRRRDARAPSTSRRCGRSTGIDTLILGEENVGFAANANRGLRAADPALDVVLLNADIVARERWLESLQYRAYAGDDVGIVGGKLLYPDGRIQHAGVQRNLGAPVWFDHRFRFKPADHGPANITVPVLAVTGACMYVKRESCSTAVGLLDERYPMAYEDVDWCLRAWEAGYRVLYFPPATLDHHESVTRGKELGEREKASQVAFWERWGEFFDGRGASVRTPDGQLRVVYVTEDTGVGGGHRDIFEHLNRMRERGHDVKLFTLGDEPDWFELDAPVHTFEDYDDLTAALARRGRDQGRDVVEHRHAGVDGERPARHPGVLRPGHRDELLPRRRAQPLRRARGLSQGVSLHDDLRLERRSPARARPGVDARAAGDRPRHVPPAARRGAPRGHAARAGPHEPAEEPAADDRRVEGAATATPELCLFGIEPELGDEHGARYVERPSDEEVNVLFNEATVFVQTSTHEGFCLPPLEAMATGGAVVCTDSHGNRDFCVDGENCLMPEPTVAAVSAAIARLLADPELRARLGEAGRVTAADYTWERRIDELEAFLEGVAAPRSIDPDYIARHG